MSAATLRALGGNFSMHVVLRGKRLRVSGSTVSLPAPGDEAPREPYSLFRGRLDALALRSGHSDARLHESNAPAGKMAGKLFSMLEQCRVEAVGSRHMAGVAENIRALQDWRLRNAGLHRLEESLNENRIEAVVLIARHRLGAPLPRAASEALDQGYPDWMKPQFIERIEALAAVRHDQEAFAARAARLIAALQFSTDEPQFGREESSRLEQASEDTSTRRIRADDIPRWDPTRGDLVRKKRQVVEKLLSPHEAGDPARYRIHTTEFDEVVDAGDLCDPGRLAQLRQQLDANIPGELYAVTRQAHRLQRYLMARQTREWQFDLEEGLLDASRLTRVIVNPLESLAYKQETETRFIDTAVTLLIDNSGSMRGAPITMAAICAEILGKTLERCGVKSEILGFTTRKWRGGRARNDWLAAGQPEQPGRLNELRHIIYKRAEVPWRRARQNLGLMLGEDLLKENIDGEALLWAHQRLLARPEPRRILMVISDGAPVDDSTMAANDNEYLERHLHAVIDWIEARSPVQLLAIGIGHDVTRYYSRAIELQRPEDLGGTMISRLLAILEETEWSAKNGWLRRRVAGRMG
ncbi:MAG: cobaltochelatase subunit CobT [Rhodospirillaceae bacterium]|nr:cobaltochelatase subunit CobT [Rhodospirillaceae bacterium]MDE0362393.1 cobaltochelatase subunit CobT [Rhodospirillaceae bacterium]